ncbi:MAG: HPP family protein [Bilophila wadsworthia]
MRELLLKMAGGEQSPPAPRPGKSSPRGLGAVWPSPASRCWNATPRATRASAADRLVRGVGGAGLRSHTQPLAQPRNLVGGHFLSALVGVSCYFLFPGTPWLASCLAVATAIALMHVTKTLHPPGGATALIAVTGGEGIHQLGYLYAFVPCLLGALIMLAIALIVNNIPKAQRYPQFWW